MTDRYFDDLTVDDRFELGEVTLSEADIVDFASRYDPPERRTECVDAAGDERDGPAASPWNVSAATMRLLADSVSPDVAIVAGMGVEDMTWGSPVHPGDTLSGVARVTDKEARDAGRGVVRFEVEVTNQRGEVVQTRTDRVLVERRGEN